MLGGLDLIPDLSLTPHAKEKRQKSAIAVRGNLLLVPGNLRRSQTSLKPSRYVPDRIGVESYQNNRLLVRERL